MKSSLSPSTITKLLLAESSLQKELEQAKTSFEHNLVDNFAFNKDYKIFKYINRSFITPFLYPFNLATSRPTLTSIKLLSLMSFFIPHLHPPVDHQICLHYLSLPALTPSVTFSSLVKSMKLLLPLIQPKALMALAQLHSHTVPLLFMSQYIICSPSVSTSVPSQMNGVST